MTVVAVVSTVNVDGKKDASGAFVPHWRREDFNRSPVSSVKT